MDRRHGIKMTDTLATGTDDGGDPNLRLLREKAGKADEATAALAAAQRENAMLRSGIDLEDPLGKYFVETYPGDPTDLVTLKAEAEKLNVPFIQKAEPVVTDPTAPAAGEVAEVIEPTGTAQRTALSDGAPADTGVDVDPRQQAKEHFEQRMKQGASRETAAGETINMLANAAHRGDPRAIVRPAQRPDQA